MNKAEAKTLGWQLMEVSKMSYLTTIQPDGYPNTRCLWNLRNRKMFGRLYPFFKEHKDDYLILFSTNTSSNKIAHIKANPKISVYYCDPEDSRGLTLIGDAVLDESKEIREVLWDSEWVFHYPGGIEDPDFSVISFKPKKARYYHRLEGCAFTL